MIPREPARVIAIRPSAGARRRARREADALAGEVIAELNAYRSGDREGVHGANWAMARLMRLVFRHRLDLDDTVAS